MNNRIEEVAEKFNAFSTRERLIVSISLLVMLLFVWWNLFASTQLTKTNELKKQNILLANEIQTLDATTRSIQQRISEGVYKSKQQKLELLTQELQKVKDLLEQKTLELIEPEEMFELMQQLIFAESNLKLTAMKRAEVKPAFENELSEGGQPEIYRHVLEVSFEGKYKDILSYITRLEGLEWKLIWDRITLKTTEYPVIKAEIEISTLSDNKYWVGL